MKIVPSILETSITSFRRRIKDLAPLFSHFQIDIADGKFVNNKTVGIEDIPSAMEQFDNKTMKRFFFDFHLMVFNYKKEIIKLEKLAKSIQIKNVLIHLKALRNQPPAKQFNNLTMEQFNLGLVLNPEEDVLANWPLILKFTSVQIMSVNPGFYGSPFLPQTLEKINVLRKLGFAGKIFLDGGINDQTLLTILKNNEKPDVLSIGNYLAEEPEEKLKILNQLIKNWSKSA